MKIPNTIVLLTTGASAAFTYDFSYSKIIFIDFDFSSKGEFQITELGDWSAHGSEIAVDCIAIERGKLTDLKKKDQKRQLKNFIEKMETGCT